MILIIIVISKVEIKYLTKIEMNKMVNGNHQGCIALTFDYKYYQLDDVITDKNDSLIIALVMKNII